MTAYAFHYDAQGWFIPETCVGKVLPYGESSSDAILTIATKAKPRKLLPSITLSASVIRSVINVSAKKCLILAKNVECEGFSVAANPSIQHFLVCLFCRGVWVGACPFTCIIVVVMNE